ncbi:unnamed protein product [Auanema sp. JU1783]|nr:unnamed protein product [Auanema sp. JU1783]
MLKWIVLSLLLLNEMVQAFTYSDQDSLEPVLSRVYRMVMLKAKRSPSMGLSLAEYMASPQGGDNFHFIPGGK